MSAPPITERHLPHFHRRAPMKEAVRAATTANITISTALNNGDSLDGLTLATGDRVLVKNQSTGSQNGIYVVGASPVRDYDESTDDPSFGYLVYVREGTTNGGTLWKNTNTAAPTIGSTSLTFSQFSSGGAVYGTPNLTLGTSNAAGSTDESIRRDATILVFDATSPTTQAFGDSAATGSATTAARRDHKHAMPTAAITTSGLTQATGKLLGRTTASTGAIEEISVGTGLTLSGGSLSATGGGGSGTLTTVEEADGSPTDSAVTKLVFPNGSVAISSHVATITFPAGGSATLPLDSYSIDGTYGNDFAGASLPAMFTRRNFTSGAETYQVGPGASRIRIATASRSAGDGYYWTAPSGDWTLAMRYTIMSTSLAQHWGLMVVDTNGTGVGVGIYHGSPTSFLLQSVTTYTTTSGTYYEANYGSNGSPNINYLSTDGVVLRPLWLYLRKSGTNYYTAASLDGTAWSPEGGPLAWAGTVDRWAMGLVALASTSVVASESIDVDWVNKIA